MTQDFTSLTRCFEYFSDMVFICTNYKKNILFAQKGVVTACHKLIEEYGYVVYLQALLEIENASCAQTVAENVFVHIYNILPQYEQKISFPKWLILHTKKICSATKSLKNLTLVEKLVDIKDLPHNYQLAVFLYFHFYSIPKVAITFEMSQQEITRLEFFINKIKCIPAIPKLNQQLCKNKISNKYRYVQQHNKLLAFLSTLCLFFLCFSSFFGRIFMSIIFTSSIAIGIIVKFYLRLQHFIWNRKWQKYITLFLICGFLHSQPFFVAGVDKKEIKSGNTVNLTLLTTESEGQPSFSCTKLKQIGKVKHTVITEAFKNKRYINKYTYKLKSQSEGQATISKIEYKTSEKTYTTTSIFIKIDTNAQQNPPPFSVQLSAPVTCYLLEKLLVKVEYYHPYEIRFDTSRYTFSKNLAFRLDKSHTYTTKEYKQRQGFIYQKNTSYLFFIPLKMGQNTLQLNTFETDVFLSKSKNTFDTVFGENKAFDSDFFRKKPLSQEFGAQKITIPLKGNSLNITVKDFPSYPRNFIFAVGEFSAKISSSKPTSTGVKLCLAISGKGNLENIKGNFFKKNDSIEIKSISFSPTTYIDNEHIQKNIFIDVQFLKKGKIKLIPHFCYFSDEKEIFSYISLEEINFESQINAPAKINKYFLTSIITISFIIILFLLVKLRHLVLKF